LDDLSHTTLTLMLARTGRKEVFGRTLLPTNPRR
jgi:hypothetical protein